MLRIIIPLMLVTGCVTTPDPWTKADTRAQIIYGVALAADTYTTMNFQDSPTAFESNAIPRSIFGREPDPESVLITSAIAFTAHYFIARRIKPEYRRFFQYGFAGAHGWAAYRNCQFHDVGC